MPLNTVHKSRNGRYSYAVTDQSGRRLTLKSRQKESLTAFKKRCDELDKKAEGETRDETLDDIFNLWVKQHLEINTSKGHQRVMIPLYEKRVKPHLGHRKITEIRRKDVYALLVRAKKEKLSAEYMKKIRLCISAPYNFVINALDYHVTAPTEGLVFAYDSVKKKKRNRVINEADLERIFNASKNSKYKNYLKILDMTGLRPSEALGLQVQDVKKDKIEIRRGITIDGLSDLKTDNAERDFPIYDDLRKVLDEQKRIAMFKTKEGWLFPSATGTPSMNAVENAFKRILRQTATWETGGHNHLKKIRLLKPALNYGLYDFRHTFATRQAENGMSITALQHLLGHADIKTTLEYYVNFTDKMINNAVLILEGNKIEDKIEDIS